MVARLARGEVQVPAVAGEGFHRAIDSRGQEGRVRKVERETRRVTFVKFALSSFPELPAF